MLIVAAQALLVAHAFEHPALDPHPCTICLYCQNGTHAPPPSIAPTFALIPQAWPGRRLILGDAQARVLGSSIRAPPLPFFA